MLLYRVTDKEIETHRVSNLLQDTQLGCKPSCVAQGLCSLLLPSILKHIFQFGIDPPKEEIILSLPEEVVERLCHWETKDVSSNHNPASCWLCAPHPPNLALLSSLPNWANSTTYLSVWRNMEPTTGCESAL